MPLGFQLLKWVAFATTVGLVAAHWLSPLDAVTVAVLAFWILLATVKAA